MTLDLLYRLLVEASGTCGLDPDERASYWITTFAPRLISLVAEECAKIAEEEHGAPLRAADAIREAFKT